MKNVLTLSEIKELPSTECSCDVCKTMCTDCRPCWGTPDEIRTLIEKGFAKQLMKDYYEGDVDGDEVGYVEIITPSLVGHEGKLAPFWPMGRCTFLNEKGLCKIHNLKPVEGRACDHTHNEKVEYLHTSIVYLWKTKNGRDVVKLWDEKNG